MLIIVFALMAFLLVISVINCICCHLYDCRLCARDPHQLFQRLESQVKEFVIEAKVRQLELLHREQQTPELAQIFLTGID
jgi:hypothetical protein